MRLTACVLRNGVKILSSKHKRGKRQEQNVSLRSSFFDPDRDLKCLKILTLITQLKMN